MKIEKFVLSAFQQNTRIVACPTTGEAMCIDPGAESPEIIDYVKANGLNLKMIALTHGHLDHVGGTFPLKCAFPSAEVIIHKGDEDLYYGLPQQPLLMGIPQHQLAVLGFDYEDPPKPTRNWQHGEHFQIGEMEFEVRHCPGHTPGHIVLIESNHKKVFVGDCLFQGSVGRSDLPGGDHEQLIDSIMSNIISLGDDFTVYSGHGPETTVGHERTTNPFLNGLYRPVRGRFV
ncbi:MBL fold metallo-hydrolase [Leptolyngbya sp. 7M]|uniref:MBL fold metallo-hydrolase n=1 Tax=Leptolyngbya sp. 7M TaxID=2812896 RepID=UPI001B8C8D1A|nr:MBL fold metallo-hydrolase [Leptolyngbya sp. 7M]QYO65868.1 MBL fold metallo-hydrolase [Leptolyngbya sp. 7M]